jgi:hypothetical protein
MLIPPPELYEQKLTQSHIRVLEVPESKRLQVEGSTPVSETKSMGEGSPEVPSSGQA